MAQDNQKLATKLFNYTQSHNIPGGLPANTTTTYNPRYQGFDEANYRKLESKIDALGLTGSKKQQAMDELYQQVLPIVQAEALNSDRRKYINDANFEVSQIQDKSAQTIARGKLTVTDLAQKVKERFNLSPTAPDEDVFNDWINQIPDGEQLLVNYLNNGDPELLYMGGLEERQPTEEEKAETAKQKLKDNFWDELWNNIKTKANVPVDSMKKRGQRTLNELGGEIYKNILKHTVGDKIADQMGISLDNYVDTFSENVVDPTIQERVIDYQTKVNDAYRAKEQKNLDQDIKNYYDNRGLTSLLKEGDFKGFFLKSLGDAAQNWEMPIVIAASVFQPEVGFALMGTDTYARENQEAFENMMENGATYEEAEKGGVVVGLINSAVEVGLERLLGGVETRASQGIRKAFMKNVRDEATKKGLGKVLGDAALTQLKASGEEGLEEIVQQIVQNAAIKTVNENQGLFEGATQAFEGGFYNPMNLLAGGGNLTNNVKNNGDTIRQSIMDGAYKAGETAGTAWNAVSNLKNKKITSDNELITRTIPEKIVENELRLTPNERADVERTGITAANFILKEGIAGLNNQEKLARLTDIGAEGYNNVTKAFKDVIPETERIESPEAQKMLSIMAKVIESSDILSEEYADYLQAIKRLGEQTSFDPYTALAIKRDFDALVSHDIYNNKGQVMKGEEKSVIAGWRSKLSEALNELGEKYGVDVRDENNRVMNSITIRDGLLRAISQNKKNNTFGLGDLGFGALLSSGHPAQALAVIGAKKFAQSKAGKISQGLYNLNNNPLAKLDAKKGASFITKESLNANNNLMLDSSIGDTATRYMSQVEDVIPETEVGANPLDTIRDRNVGANPTDVENGGRVLRNEINENGAVKEMTAEEEYQEMVNRIMTPKEVEKIVEMAWNANNLRDFYDGEYRTALEWLKGEGSDQVEMYAENTLATQRMIEAHPELLDGGTTFSEVLDAYLDGTLTGQSDASIERMDLSQAEAYTPTKFYEPQELKNAEEVWEEANKKVTKSNKNEVYQARGDFVIDAHNPGFVQELGLTDAEVNKKLRDWAAYPAKAKNLSNRINDGVAAPYRWAGLENSSIVKSITVSDADLEKMVKKVEGNSQEYERKYISNAMLALNTHIDWSPLTFEFVRGNELDRVDQQGRTHNVAGNYNEQTNTIRISRAGQNTVAHEMGHYLDYLRGRQLFGVNVTLSEGGGRNLESLTEDQKKFVKHFDSFMTDLKLSGDSYSEYTMTPTEIFARFVGRFTEWTRNTATNGRFGYESKWYNDKFIEKDYIEFTKILQEKSKLDLANEYTKYQGYIERNGQRMGSTR